MTLIGVSIIICCHNSVQRLPPTLDHLSAQAGCEDLSWEIIIVDNASNDGTGDFAINNWQNTSIPFRVVLEPELGLMNARQRGFQETKYEVVSFVDDDNWVAGDWVKNVYQVMSSHPHVGACGGQVEAVYESEPPAWFLENLGSYAIGRQAEEEGVLANGQVLWGAGLTVRRSAWMELLAKGYSPLLTGRKGRTLTTGEDLEICYALLLSGWQLYYSPELMMEHFMPASRMNRLYLYKMKRAHGRASFYIQLYRRLYSEFSSGVQVVSRKWHKKLYDHVINFITHPRIFIKALTYKDSGEPDILMMHKQLGSFSERVKLLNKGNTIENQFRKCFNLGFDKSGLKKKP